MSDNTWFFVTVDGATGECTVHLLPDREATSQCVLNDDSTPIRNVYAFNHHYMSRVSDSHLIAIVIMRHRGHMETLSALGNNIGPQITTV